MAQRVSMSLRACVEVFVVDGGDVEMEKGRARKMFRIDHVGPASRQGRHVPVLFTPPAIRHSMLVKYEGGF